MYNFLKFQTKFFRKIAGKFYGESNIPFMERIHPFSPIGVSVNELLFKNLRLKFEKS